MIGSKSHIAGDGPSGESIVRGTIQEVGQKDSRTAEQMGVTVTPPDNGPDPWGDDTWN